MSNEPRELKKLPSSALSERLILGSLLLGHLPYEQASTTLAPGDFATESNRRIFLRMKDLHDRGEKIDRITLANELTRHNQLDGIGGFTYILSLDENMPELVNAEAYARDIKETSIRRRLLFQGQTFSNSCYESTGSTADIVADQIKALQEIERDVPAMDEVPSLGDIVNKIGHLEILSPSARNSIKTKILLFDQVTTGLEPSTLTIIGGRPSSGKSMCAMTMAQNIAESEIPVAVFSLEMSARSLMDRMMCGDAKVDLMAFRLGNTDAAQQKRLAASLAHLYDLPLYIDDKPVQTVADISRKADRLKREKGVRVIFLDYVQLMAVAARGANAKRNTNEILTDIVEGLKAIAKRLDIAFVALSQLSRGTENRKDHKPTLGDLRESGSIEQAADLIALLYRQYQYEPSRDDLRDSVEMIIAKQRQGPTGSITLKFLGQFSRIEDL